MDPQRDRCAIPVPPPGTWMLLVILGLVLFVAFGCSTVPGNDTGYWSGVTYGVTAKIEGRL